ncbi:uncharacterized protein DDB_G0271670-like [Halichondria panicea]|uniref:uncharacterized protein DDB_G0271670-like n=1 Tax=Halichondria panicea TaxID=6063 RepID=UPI00312B81A0
MALKILVASFLLLVLQSEALPVANLRAKKQAARAWTIGAWSECTATCGTGLRTRSVRCLDEDLVIASDCDNQMRPVPYEFCAQIDCTTNAPTPNSLPADGDYQWVNGDGTSIMLNFEDQGNGVYVVMQNTTESDQTRTTFTETVTASPTSTQRQSSFSVSSRDNDITTRQSTGGDNILVANGEDVLIVDNIQQQSVEGIDYTGGTITLPDGTVVANNVNTLTYFDGFRFYEFTSDTINDLPGPGMLYYNPTTGTALYSINGVFNSQLDSFISSITPPTQPEEVTPTTAPQSTTRELVTEDQVLMTTTETVTVATEPEATTAEPEATTAEPEATTAEPEATTAEPEGTTAEPEGTTAEPITTEESSKSRSRSKTSKEESKDDSECTKKRCKSGKGSKGQREEDDESSSSSSSSEGSESSSSSSEGSESSSNSSESSESSSSSSESSESSSSSSESSESSSSSSESSESSSSSSESSESSSSSSESSSSSSESSESSSSSSNEQAEDEAEDEGDQSKKSKKRKG